MAVDNTVKKKSINQQMLVRRYGTPVLVVGLYFGITALLTWPALANLGTLAYGDSGDTWLWAWMGWWRKYALLNGLNYRFIPIEVAPFGTDHAFRAYFGTVYALALLSIIFNEIAAFNIMVMVGHVLSASLTYALAHRLGRSHFASFFAGLVFGFSSYMINHGQTHVDQSQIWIIPLFMLALLRLHRKRDLKSAILMGMVFGIGAHFHAYYGYFSALAALTFAACEIIQQKRQSKTWRTAINWRLMSLYTAGAGIALLIYLPELAGIVRDLSGKDISPLRADNVLSRDLTWFFAASARPWDYLLPPENHPILGGLSQAAYTRIESIQAGEAWFWWTAGDPVYNEQYLGYGVLLLTGYALWRWRKGTLKASIGSTEEEHKLWMPFLILLIIVGLLFSAPPYIPVGAYISGLWGPLEWIRIPTPTLITMFAVSPLRMVRRAILLIIMAMALLSATSLDDLRERITSQWLYRGVIVVILLVFGFEHLHQRLHVDGVVPEDYIWLAEQPGEPLIMTYPFGQYRDHLIQQRYHQLPILDTMAYDANFVTDNLHQLMEQSIGTLDKSDLSSKLAALGIDYVVNWTQNEESLPEGFTQVLDTARGEVLAVTAEPAPLIVTHTLRYGYWMSAAEWAWQAESYTITVWNPLNDPVLLDIAVEADGEQPAAMLVAERTLTPLPEQIAISGILNDNPMLRPDYDTEPVEARVTAEGFMFEGLIIETGETTLVLRWEEANDEWPQVNAVTITKQGPAIENPTWVTRNIERLEAGQ